MNVGQLREHLAGLPGDLEVHVDAGQGESRTASTMARYGACVVLEAELDPDETPHGGRPAGYIDPDESPADSHAAMWTPSSNQERDIAAAADEIRRHGA